MTLNPTEIATAAVAPVLAVADKSGMVQIFDAATGSVRTRFTAEHQWGGRRLALSHDGASCVVGSFENGIAAFDTATGEPTWQAALEGVQALLPTVTGSLLCEHGDRLISELRFQDGVQVGELGRGSLVAVSRFDDLVLIADEPRRRPRSFEEALDGGGLTARVVNRGTGKTLALQPPADPMPAAFGRDSLAFRTLGGTLECVALADASTRWKKRVASTMPVGIDFSEGTDNFCVCERVDAAPWRVALIEASSGERRVLAPLPPSVAFARLIPALEAILLPDGVIVGLDGTVRLRLWS